MDQANALQSEVDRLRAEVEGYRQRELESLRAQLAEAKAAASHYRSEAERNAEIGRQIHRELTAANEQLKTKLDTMTKLQNGRPNLVR